MNNTQISSCSTSGNLAAVKVGMTFAYCVIFIFSLAGNSFIGIIVYKTKAMRKTINFLIVNMAMSDLLFPIFAVPWIITEFHVGSWLISGPLGQALCKLAPFSTVVSISVSIQSLVLIAVDRFGAVVFPLRSPLISSKRCSFFILATWIIAIASQFPYGLAYKLVQYPEKLSCEPHWNEAFGKSSYFVFKSYVVAQFVIELGFPFVSLGILYPIIFIKLKKQKIPDGQSDSAAKQHYKRQRNVLKMAIAILLGFAICWAPFGVFTGLSTFFWDHATMSSCHSMRFLVIANFFLHGNCAINPCICFILCGNYRQGLRNLLNPLLRRICKVNL